MGESNSAFISYQALGNLADAQRNWKSLVGRDKCHKDIAWVGRNYVGQSGSSPRLKSSLQNCSIMLDDDNHLSVPVSTDFVLQVYTNG
jgi:hypothetical protein